MTPFGVSLPPLNSGVFKHSLVLRKATRLSREHLWPLLNTVGNDRVEWLIQNNKPLTERIFALHPDWLEGLKQGAGNYKWAVDAITDQDAKKMLPDWVAALATKNGEVGEQWLKRELNYLRSFFA